MKKLLALLLLSPFASADMDYVCTVEIHENFPWMWEQIEEKGCERNNILRVETTLDYISMTREEALVEISAQYCRFDRNIVIEDGLLTCVLYSAKRRKFKG